MEVFVTKALKKIRKETSRKHKELRDSCDAVLSTLAKSAERQAMATKQYNDALKANGGVDTGNVPPPPPSDANADKYFEPFRLACASKKSEIMETALYCLHNLCLFPGAPRLLHVYTVYFNRLETPLMYTYTR